VEIRSLRQLAKVLGVSQPFLSQVRAGKRPLPESMGERVSALGAYHLLMGDKQIDENVITDLSHGYGSNVVGRQGLEPWTPGLKVRCSAN
jgi:hypothetical protein